MNRLFRDLYEMEAYPAMSHPSADPLMMARVARAVGVDVKNVSKGKILDIGCASGHHILSLASRWPEAECAGMDLSAKMIRKGRNLARQAGLKNVRFYESSISDFEPEGTFDVILAHGVFSWVEDEVKLRLVDFIAKRLSEGGIAVISFNVAAGWKERMKVVQKVRAIQDAGHVDEMTALDVMRTVAEGDEIAIVEDMFSKGAEVLAFDDFGPLMDAWSLGAVLKLTQASGLRWLGDSLTGEKGNDAEDQKKRKTFRSELFCRVTEPLVDAKSQNWEVNEGDRKVPMFPKLNAWRMLCVREGLAVPDGDLKSCIFPFSQLKVMAEMDGKKSVAELMQYAKRVSPELDFIAWLRHISERGCFS